MGAASKRGLSVAQSLLEGLGASPTAAAMASSALESAIDSPATLATGPEMLQPRAEEPAPQVRAVGSKRAVLWRADRIADAKRERMAVADLTRDWRRERLGTPEAGDALCELRHGIDELEHIEDDLKHGFVPQHSPGQLISPQHLLTSSVFNAKGRQVPREREVTFVFARTKDGDALYEGPELRQADGLVMMGLVNMVRDLRVGTLVEFDPGEMCRWLFQRYDGPTRVKLRETIQRLQKALLKYPTFSVHLVERFDYPKTGTWRVRLEPGIVRTFQQSMTIWLDLEMRRTLPEGLTTWLLGYVESQSQLIPMSIESLKSLSGSETKSMKAFRVVLARSLNSLVAAKVVECGWRVHQGRLHWRKSHRTPLGKSVPAAALPLA